MPDGLGNKKCLSVKRVCQSKSSKQIIYDLEENFAKMAKFSSKSYIIYFEESKILKSWASEKFCIYQGMSSDATPLN